MAVKLISDEERFWSKVDRDGPVPASRPDLGPCWIWLGSDIRGYGQFSIGSRTDASRRQVKAHRFGYELVAGPIPDGLTLDHLCRTTLCVRGSHLEPVSQRVNTERNDSPATVNRLKAVCIRGHRFDAVRNGRRACKTCMAATSRRWRKAHGRPERTPDEIERQRAANREYTRAYRARRRQHQDAAALT